MKTELSLDREALRAELARVYGIKAGPLEFLPKGEVACAYLLSDASGKRFLLKIFAASQMAGHSVLRMGIWLPLCWELHHRGWLRELPVPIKALDGALSTKLLGLETALFNFIEGEVLNRRELWTPDAIRGVGELHAKIHAQSGRARPLLGPGEDFVLPFAQGLRDSLENLKTQDARLRDAVLPKKDLILKRLSQVINRGRALPRDGIPQGLVHGDLHGSNMVLAEDGKVHALDWEDARLAPFEQDFVSWHESPDFGLFMEGYARVLPPPGLSKGTLEFYAFRRRLVDIADWISRLLRTDLSEEQRQNDLEGLSEDLAVLAHL